MKGWHNDPYRHSLAARGIPTKPPSYGKFSEMMLMMEGRIPGMSPSQMRECESYWIYDHGIKDGVAHVSHLEDSMEFDGITHYVIRIVDAMSGFEANDAYEDKEQRKKIARDILVDMYNDIQLGDVATTEAHSVARVVSFPMDWDSYNTGFHEGVHNKLLNEDMINWTTNEVHFRIEEKLTRRG